ncbi:MAG TPA: diguanylate cyclase [Anaerolineales bacterium]|jgi:GGDEF domain-containing protein|nr:diguanylate cyclase [Anaerolineales bacterium]
MTNLKRSFFGAAVYLAVIFVLGQSDYAGRPLINFANYFYLAVLVAIPLTLFFPRISRISVYVPLLFWAVVYIVPLQLINRNYSANKGELAVIALEFMMLEVGVWFAHQLAVQISHAESIMDALALSAFPNRARDIESENQRIKIELTRSRRYHRPLSVVIIQSESDDEKLIREALKNIQHDLLSRFTSARVGQIIDDRVRQTDLVLRDYKGRFIVLCPETDFSNASLLAQRISQAIKERTNLRVLWGVAAFPEEALTFEDLLQKARERLTDSTSIPSEVVPIIESHQLR